MRGFSLLYIWICYVIKSDSSFNDQLVVKIPPSIPAQNCETVLDNLQVLKLLI